MDLETAEWCDYTFEVHEVDDLDDEEWEWREVPGVYVFAVREGLDWNPLYVGETGSFYTRLTNLEEHHDWAAAVRRGVTHIHSLRVDGELARRQSIEGAIYDEHKPRGELPLNDKIPPGSKDYRPPRRRR